MNWAFISEGHLAGETFLQVLHRHGYVVFARVLFGGLARHSIPCSVDPTLVRVAISSESLGPVMQLETSAPETSVRTGPEPPSST
ncbi:hypothetical protein VTK56DRAFT_2195 [Thermocarpiscus australiensis]